MLAFVGVGTAPLFGYRETGWNQCGACWSSRIVTQTVRGATEYREVTIRA
jgi:hypothetical protein